MSHPQEPFETRLRRQPLNPAPAEWRAEIMAAMRAEASTAPDIRQGSRSASPLRLRLRAIFWPSPFAWGGLAAVWIAISILHLVMQDDRPVVAHKTPSPAPVMTVELRQQQRLFAELLGANEVRVADRQRIAAPKPRSERAEVVPA